MMNQELTPTHPAGAELATTTERAERVRRYVDASSSPNTQRAYATDWRKFVEYCRVHGYQALPAMPETVVDYLTRLADEGLKASTIERSRAAIAYGHQGHTNPCADDRVKVAMKGIRRKLGIRATPKAALPTDDLALIVAMLPDDLRGLRDRALLLMGWQGAFRRSELVALNVDDIDTHGGKMTITIRKSKTDQDGAGLYKVLPELADKSICPVAAYRAWLSAADIRSGAVFRSIDRWGHTRDGHMDAGEVARIVKRSCQLASIDPQRFAGHSLRSGFVTAASDAGASDSDIMEQTGHKSSATLKRYRQMAGRGAQRATLAALGIREKK